MFINNKVRISALAIVIALCMVASCKKNKKYLGEFEEHIRKSPDGKSASNFTKKLNSVSYPPLTPNASHSDDPKHSEGQEDGEHLSDGHEVSGTPSRSYLEDDKECLEHELIETSSSTGDCTFGRDCTFDYKREVPELSGVIEAIAQHGEFNLISHGHSVPLVFFVQGIYNVRGICICTVLDNERSIRVLVLKFDRGYILQPRDLYELMTFKINAYFLGPTIVQVGCPKSSSSGDCKSLVDSRNHEALFDFIKGNLLINSPNNAQITLEYESNFFES